MGLFNNLFSNNKKEEVLSSFFESFNAYTPVFTTFDGGLYEMELTRAVIHSFATHVSKLKPEVKGSGNTTLERILQYKPNPYMDTSKFLYRLATIFMINNNAFIAPLWDEYYEEIIGYYPLLPNATKIVNHKGIDYVIYDFGGKKGAIELSKTGILNQFQYKSDFFGEKNTALNNTLDLLHAQNEGMINGIRNGASIRFLAKIANVLAPKDIEKEKKRFVSDNLSVENSGGVMLFDAKYEDVKQINSTPFLVDPKQMESIKNNVFNYFGTNENILQNKYSSDEWNAYYEGKIEPFALQLSLVLTNMTFSQREIAFGNEIIMTANRLQYLTNSEKLNTVTQLFDRGFITHNQGLEIFNMESRGEEGDKLYIRKEYAETKNLDKELKEEEEKKEDE